MSGRKSNPAPPNPRRDGLLAQLSKQDLTGYLGPQEYNNVVAAAQLVDISLVRSTFEVEPRYFNDEPRELSFSASDPPSVSFNEEEGAATGVFAWRVKATRGDSTLLDLAATYVVLYDGLQGLQPQAIEAFVQRVGKIATFPYFRALVSHVSWSSNTSLPILPILRDGAALEPPSTPEQPVPSPEDASRRSRRKRSSKQGVSGTKSSGI